MANTKIPSELIADSAITAAKLADGTITTADIADSNVTTAKIADSNVTTAKIGDAQVTTAKIVDANVTTAKIADSNVTTAKILDNNITSAKLASALTLGGVTTFSGNIALGDSVRANLGTDSDLALFHTGGNGVIHNTTGALRIRANTLNIQDYTNEDAMITAISDGAVTLFHNNQAKLATASGGITVTGTATMDGLTVEGETLSMSHTGNTSTISLTQKAGTQNSVATISANREDTTTSASRLLFNTNDGTSTLQRMRIANGGDISFYEDTGTTAKFFWDASAESLGIGTSGPDGELHVLGTGGGNGDIYVERPSGAKIHLQAQSANGKIGTSSNHNLGLNTNGTTRVTIDTNGKVGIGTSSPQKALDIAGASTSGGGVMRLSGTGSASQGDVTGAIQFYNADDTDNTAGVFGMLRGIAGPSGGEGSLQILTDMPSEGADASNITMHFNSNGNVGIGTSSPNTTLTLSDGTDEFDFGVTTNQLLIKSVTSDGSDDQRIIIDAGNGGLSSTRGAYIALSGNEASTEPGHAIYQMGNVTGSSHVFRKAGGTDAVTIDSSGNVGIGYTTPYSKLWVEADGINLDDFSFEDASSIAHLTLAGSNAHVRMHLGTMDVSPYGVYIQGGFDNTPDASGTGNSGTEPLLLNPLGGNVGIGTSDPSTNLSIFNSSPTWNQYATLRLATETEGTYYGEVSFHRGTSDDTDRGLVFNLGGTERMRILNTGSVGIGDTSPMSRLQIDTPNSATASHYGRAEYAGLNLTIPNTVGAINQLIFSNEAAESYGYGGIGMIMTNGSGVGLADMVFTTKESGSNAVSTERMRILSTGQIVTGGLTSTSAALHLYSDNSWSGILTLQSQAAANATAQIAFMSRDSSNVNDDAYIKYNNSSGSTTNQFDFYPSNNRTFSVSNHGSTHYGDESSNNGIGKFIGSVAPHNAGNRYIHVQLSTNYNEMAHIFVHGYSYTSALIEGGCAFYFYNNANQTTLYDFRSSGSIVAGHCNSSNNYAEIVIDTLGTATTNRWGNVSIYGGQDNIIGYHHTEIVQVSYTNSTARAFT